MNYADLGPNFSAITFSIGNTLGGVGGFLAPITFGAITEDNVRIFIIE